MKVSFFVLALLMIPFLSHAEKIGSCATCHGLDGNSVNPDFPKIAGQKLSYLTSELKAYRSETRLTPDYGYMGYIKSFTDDEIKEVAEYFAAQTAIPGQVDVDSKVLELGKSIFEKGIPAKNVEACTTCHGDKGEGMGKNPRIASQHSEYFVKQMNWYKSGERTGKIMPGLVSDLNDEEIEALGFYLESI